MVLVVGPLRSSPPFSIFLWWVEFSSGLAWYGEHSEGWIGASGTQACFLWSSWWWMRIDVLWWLVWQWSSREESSVCGLVMDLLAMHASTTTDGHGMVKKPFAMWKDLVAFRSGCLPFLLGVSQWDLRNKESRDTPSLPLFPFLALVNSKVNKVVCYQR